MTLPAISRLTADQTVDRLAAWLNEPAYPCRVVNTCNLDHLVQMEHNEALRHAYHAADLITADGGPVKRLSEAPERVTGVDLTLSVLADALDLRVYLLGASPAASQRAAIEIDDNHPGATAVGHYSPPPGFEHDSDECARIIHKINAVNVDLLIIGFGCPKQEIWISKHRHKIRAKVAICAGGTIDFIAGEQKRAPKWMRVGGLEAAWRAMSDPKRMVPRYWRNLLAFPRFFWRYRVRRSVNDERSVAAW